MGKDDYKQRLKHTGRNDGCPCGSGKKYKKCHLEKDEALERAELTSAASERETAPTGAEIDKQDGGRAGKWRNERQKVGKARSGSDTHPNIPRRGAV